MKVTLTDLLADARPRLGEFLTNARAWLGKLPARLAELVSGQASKEKAALSAAQAAVQELQTRVSTLEREATRNEQAQEQVTRRLTRMREKYDERRKTAAERWREIQKLRGENKRLDRRLVKATTRSTEPKAALPKKAAKASKRSTSSKPA